MTDALKAGDMDTYKMLKAERDALKAPEVVTLTAGGTTIPSEQPKFEVTGGASIDDTDLDGEKVMMNLDKGEYFMMNEVGSRIWEIISEPVNVKGIIDTLRSEYEVDEETCKDTVVEFLGRLNNADLISIS